MRTRSAGRGYASHRRARYKAPSCGDADPQEKALETRSPRFGRGREQELGVRVSQWNQGQDLGAEQTGDCRSSRLKARTTSRLIRQKVSRWPSKVPRGTSGTPGT